MYTKLEKLLAMLLLSNILLQGCGDPGCKMMEAGDEVMKSQPPSTTQDDSSERSVSLDLAVPIGSLSENFATPVSPSPTLSDQPSSVRALQPFSSTPSAPHQPFPAKAYLLEKRLAKRGNYVDHYIHRTEASYPLPPDTVTDPIVNKRKRTEVGTLLRELENFQRGYERDLQAFSSNLDTLNQTQVNEQWPVFEANNQRLKDAIASLKSVQIQLQQQCTTGHEALFKTLEEEDQEAINILLDDPKLEVDAKDKCGYRPLHYATEAENEEAAGKLIVDRGADVNTRQGDDETSTTPLRMASIRGYSNMVRILLDHGASPNDDNALLGNCPLANAIIGKHIDIIRMLLNAGANVNYVLPDDDTSLLCLAIKFSDSTHLDIHLVRTLLEHGADVNYDGGGYYKRSTNQYFPISPLTIAINYGEKDIARLILENGADVKKKYHNNTTISDFVSDNEDLNNDEKDHFLTLLKNFGT